MTQPNFNPMMQSNAKLCVSQHKSLGSNDIREGKGNLWRMSIALPEFTPSRKVNILEILENASHNIDTIFLKTKKIKDCQVVQTRISRHHGGKDHKTELQVGAVDENDLYKVMALWTKIIFFCMVW